MRQNIKLPEFDLCTNGQLHGETIYGKHETIYRKWNACYIFEGLVARAEESNVKPQFKQFSESTSELSVDFLATQEARHSTPPIHYGRTRVFGNIAVKMQRISESDVCLAQQGLTELLPNVFYISTEEMQGYPDPRFVLIKYVRRLSNGEQQEGVLDFRDHKIFPLSSPLTAEMLIQNNSEIKEVVLKEAIENNHISDMQMIPENPECLGNEMKMQRALNKDSTLHSHIPTPLGVGVDNRTGRHISAFEVPEGYYTYLSDIADTATFVNSACRSAHDLGRLLTQGYVFQNLISVFHERFRPYTLLPDTTGVQAVKYGGLPGKIVRVVGQSLYENMGLSGIRDVGDLEFINDFHFYNSYSREVDAPASLKIAHFISHYLTVFSLLIGNRARKLESTIPGENHWEKNHEIYSEILQALFRGLNITLSEEELLYIDPSKIRAQKSNGSEKSMQPGQKFNQQLRQSLTSGATKL